MGRTEGDTEVTQMGELRTKVPSPAGNTSSIRLIVCVSYIEA